MNNPDTPAREVVPAANILAQDRLVTADEVARFLVVSAAWVYAHAEELEAVPLGNGSKPRLRFDAATIMAYLARASCTTGRQSDAAQTRMVKPKRRARRGGSVALVPDLLPIRGRSTG